MTATALRTAMVRARIDPGRKHRAEAVLKKPGIAPSQAVNMLYAQIELLKAMLFDVRIPTKKTAASMNDARKGRVRKAKSAADLFVELEA